MIVNNTHPAYELFQDGRYDEAVQSLQALFDQGDAQAGFYLGWMSQKGFGVQRDEIKAEKFYRVAYEGGVVEADYYLGCLYRSLGRYDDALFFLKKATLRGNPSAAYWTYIMCCDSQGCSVDESEEMIFLEQAANLGHLFARRDLAKKMMAGKLGIMKIPKAVFMYLSSLVEVFLISMSNPDDLRIR